jgi:hypothetical protein
MVSVVMIHQILNDLISRRLVFSYFYLQINNDLCAKDVTGEI